MITISKNLTKGALAIAAVSAVSASAFSFAPEAKAISFINGTFSTVGAATNEISTNGSPFVLATNSTISIGAGSGDFSSLIPAFSAGSLAPLTFASPVSVIPGQSWNYSVTTSPIAYTAASGVTVKWLSPAPKTFLVNNGSPNLPFSGSISSVPITIDAVFSAPGFLDTFGTMSYGYTYSQSAAGVVAPSGSKTISFAALGEAPPPPEAIPEPMTILGSLTALGFATVFKRKKRLIS
jgi:hypothetical protein